MPPQQAAASPVCVSYCLLVSDLAGPNWVWTSDWTIGTNHYKLNLYNTYKAYKLTCISLPDITWITDEANLSKYYLYSHV